MQNLLLTIAYVGTNYHGFQVQQNAITVAEVFQNAVESIYGSRPPIKGCSRTDSGVHANHYCLSMQVGEEAPKIPPDNLVKALNIALPPDIAVLSCKTVPADFHARYACKAKRYVYLFYNAPVRNPFLYGRVYHCNTLTPLDHVAMDTAAQGFLGAHDFSAFCAAGGSIADKTRTITAATVTRQDQQVAFSVTGDGFLYNMVRIMAGTLLAVGQGQLSPQAIPAIIAGQNRANAGITLPPQGLYLDKVFY